MSETPVGMQGITEDDIAAYLASTPGFFERHAELLGSVQLANPHGPRAVSLQERQADMLRERIKGLELAYKDLDLRHKAALNAGHENVGLVQKMHEWTCQVLRATEPEQFHSVLVEGLKQRFGVPQVALRAWGLRSVNAAWTEGVSEDVQTFAASLTVPYCGLNAGFEAARWLGDSVPAQSLAMVPLRRGPDDARCFGLLVLGSPDALRYQSDMGTTFLEQVGEIASAALSHLLPAD